MPTCSQDIKFYRNSISDAKSNLFEVLHEGVSSEVPTATVAERAALVPPLQRTLESVTVIVGS